MRDKNTPGTTPGRTPPRGFRALFSLWENKREGGRSPLRRGKSANQADVPEVPSSPLRPLESLPNQASETPQDNEPMLQATSPAMLMAARNLLSSSMSWSATPRGSGSKPPSAAAVGAHRQQGTGNPDVVNRTPVDLNPSNHPGARPGISGATPKIGSRGDHTTEEPTLPNDLSTPQLLGDSTASKTPTTHGLTPPTLSAHVPVPTCTPVVAPASRGASMSDSGMSGNFSTCDEGSAEQFPEEQQHRLEHAGHTPAPFLGLSQVPTPPSDEAVPPHHPCDLARCASVSGIVCELVEEAAPRHGSDAPIPGAASNPSQAAEAAPTVSARSALASQAPLLQEPPSRPDVSSPIIECLERSGGSDALVQAGSSGVLRSGSSGAARAAAATDASGPAPARHRHQRSGALDFDAALLLTSAEEEPGEADTEQPIEKECDPLQVSTQAQSNAGDDVRGSDDSVVLHPTPSGGSAVPSVAAAAEGDTLLHDAMLEDVPEPTSTSTPRAQPEAAVEEMLSPSPHAAAPVDGMTAVGPLLDGQEMQHTAPVMGVGESSPCMSTSLPNTPSRPAVDAAPMRPDFDMAGGMPPPATGAQDSDMAGSTPAPESGMPSMEAPDESISQRADARSAPLQTPLQTPTPATDMAGTPPTIVAAPRSVAGTPVTALWPQAQQVPTPTTVIHGATGPARLRTPEMAMVQSDDNALMARGPPPGAQENTARSPTPETVMMAADDDHAFALLTPPGAADRGIRSPTPETAVMPWATHAPSALVRPHTAGETPHSSTPETMVIPTAYAPAVSDPVLRSPTPETAAPVSNLLPSTGNVRSPTPMTEVLPLPSVSAAPITFAPAAEARGSLTPQTEVLPMPQVLATVPTPTRVVEAHQPSATATPQCAADDQPKTPDAATAVPVPQNMQSQSFALVREETDSVAATPTAVLLARFTSYMADAAEALQAPDDHGSPTTAVLGDQDEGATAERFDGEDCAMVNAESVLLSGGSVPLAMAPTDSADQPGQTAPEPGPDTSKPLPMLSPVQAEECDAAAAATAAMVPTPAGQDTDSADDAGGDENETAGPGPGDASPSASRFQVPQQPDAVREQDMQEDVAPADEQDVPARVDVGALVGDWHQAVPDLSMECSDAVVEHDEDACTRLESPVPTAVALPAQADETPVDVGGPAIETDMSMHSRTVSSIAMSQDFAMCASLRNSTGVPESTESMIAASGTDSILGIASGICGAAVVGALSASTSLPSSVTWIARHDAENLTAPLTGDAVTPVHLSPGMANETASVSEYVPVPEVPGTAITGQDSLVEPTSAAAMGPAGLLPTPPQSGAPMLAASSPAHSGGTRATSITDVTPPAALTAEDMSKTGGADGKPVQEYILVPEAPSDVSKGRRRSGRRSASTTPRSDALQPTPPVSGRPSLRRDRNTPRASAETPGDTVLHPIASSTFRVTDSCADRVWRMLQGSAAGLPGSAHPGGMATTIEEIPVDAVDDTAADDHDSMSVPDFPSLDEAAYAQLEREAMQVPDSAAGPPPQPPVERPSTPPPPLELPGGGVGAQERGAGSPSLQPTFCESPGMPRRSARRSGSAARDLGDDAAPVTRRDEELRQTAITDTLVNQSLSASIMLAGVSTAADEETLLESVLDADSAEPDALPSPTHLQPKRGAAARSPSHGSAAQRSRTRTVPLRMVAAAARGPANRRGSTGEGGRRSPVTSTFDAAAIVMNSDKKRSQRRLSGAERPKTAGHRSSAAPSPGLTSARPSTSSGPPSRRASQTSPAVSPLTAQRPASSGKRSLSHKTIHNITPNHNPNYRPHTPGRTPQAVPPNASPDPKRCRNEELAAAERARLEQPLDLGRDLQDVDDMIDMDPPQRAAAPFGVQARHGGGRGTSPRAIPACAEPMRPDSSARRTSQGTTPKVGQNLRDSLLTLDPMRLSYGPNGLVNLAGDEDKVLFQADIEAITQALDEYPSQSDVTNENSSAQPLQTRGDGMSPGRGVSPLRVSRVLKARTPAGVTPKAAEAETDTEDLHLRLAVALRQAEHFRRENAGLHERVSRMQEYIESESFLKADEGGTATLLSEVSPDARQAEAFAQERSRLQDELAAAERKCQEQSQQMHALLTKQLPAAHAAADRAERELAAERARSAAAAEAAAATIAQEKARMKQAVHDVGKLRSELDKHSTRAAEAALIQRRLEAALANAQSDAGAAEARYLTKCKEISKTKLANPSGIGGGIGGAKLKQDLAAMTAERDALLVAERDLGQQVSRITAALHAKQTEYDQLSKAYYQALAHWDHSGT
eukprot:jgi/Ulvmu1/1121/UM106_0038.1